MTLLLSGSDVNASVGAGVVQLEQLSFHSVDEPMLIQMGLEQLRRAMERDRWIGRALGASSCLPYRWPG